MRRRARTTVVGVLALLAGGATAARAQSTPTTPSSPSPAPIGTGDRSRPRPDTLPRPERADTVRRSRDSVTVAVPVGSDTSRQDRSDSLRGTPDSLKTPKVKRDSIKAALVRAELPTQGIVAGPAYRFRGDTILASGALTLADLLERVPGVTVFRSGYVASAQTAAYLGDFRRIRVFRDGVELDPVDPRNGGVLDLVDVQLWQAEEVSIEPTAGEVRVFIRTRAPRNTTPQTRVDVFTGDQETNLYRAFYGKRFTNGGLLQVNLQQFSTGERSGGRTGGGGDVVNALVRLGWARGNRSIDLTLTRLDRRRNKTLNYLTEDSVLVNFVGRRDEGYLRAGFGDPDQGVWAQAIANVLHFRQESPKTGTLDGDTVTSANLRDTTVYRNQYVLTGGLTRWGVRFTATDRYRVGNHDAYHAPQLRASYERDRLTVSAVAERVGTDSTKRVDVSGRLAILPRLAVLGGASTTTGDSAVGGTRRVARGEVAAQVAKNAWLSVGRIIRDGGIFSPPRVYAVPDGTPVPAAEGRVGGMVGSLRGEVLPFVTADVAGTAWDREGLYRPRYQARAELRFASNFLRRFPSGEFGLNVALSDDYRSAVVFPLAPAPGVGPSAANVTPTRAAASNLIGGQLEIRIQRAVISYQARNIASRLYQDVPGIYGPRGTISFYGVRWEFSN